MIEPYDAADLNVAELLVKRAVYGMLYDAGWRRPWWAFWHRPPEPVILRFDPPEPGEKFGLTVTVREDGLFEISVEGPEMPGTGPNGRPQATGPFPAPKPS